MKIICAGFSKTGTKSLAAALRTLDFTVYDYAEHFLEHGEQWAQILDPNHKKHPSNRMKLKEMLKNMYKDVDAVTDAPANHFWEEILEVYPDAKVVLVIREENSWFRSMTMFSKAIASRTPVLVLLWNAIASQTTRKHLLFAKRVFQEIFGRFPTPKNISEPLAIKRYRSHNSGVVQRCPPKSLLIFCLEEGWKPLCEFLQIPSKIVSGNLIKNGKSIPFPKRNVRNEGIKLWKDGDYPIPKKTNQEIKEFKKKIAIIFFAFMIILLVHFFVWYSY